MLSHLRNAAAPTLPKVLIMDEIFAEMKAEATQSERQIRTKADASKKKLSKKAESLEAIMASANANEASRKKKEKKEKKE